MKKIPKKLSTIVSVLLSIFSSTPVAAGEEALLDFDAYNEVLSVDSTSKKKNLRH